MNKSLFLFALLILLASNGICQNITADTTQATIFYKKAFILSNNLKRDSSVLVFQKTSKIYLNLSKKYKAIEKYCIGNYLDCQNQLAYDISTFGKSDTALLILENAANIAKQNFGESSIYLADNYLSTGDIWKDKRNINKSLENYLKAEEFYNKLNKGKILKTANLLYNIGMDYYYIADFKKSLKYFFKSLEIRKELLGEKNIDVAA